MSIELYVPFVAKELRTVPERVPPEYCEAARVQELLWPVASFFEAVARIADYEVGSEAEADAVLEALEADPTTWIDFTSKAARVLFDRAKFALGVLEVNAQAGELVLCRPPASLDADLRRVAAALLWLHRMDIPRA